MHIHIPTLKKAYTLSECLLVLLIASIFLHFSSPFIHHYRETLLALKKAQRSLQQTKRFALKHRKIRISTPQSLAFDESFVLPDVYAYNTTTSFSFWQDP